MKIRVGILCNEIENDHQDWELSCMELPDLIDYKLVNLVGSKWHEELCNGDFDILLAKPGGINSSFKQLYDERIYIIANCLKKRIFPAPDEIFIYENKRFHYSWLKAMNVKIAETNIIYKKEEGLNFVTKTNFPIVAKTNIGASGKGVEILRNIKEAKEYIGKTFSSGARIKSGPNWRKDSPYRKMKNVLFNPGHLKKRLDIYRRQRNEVQTNFVILQEFINHTFEWRVVRIGDSFFAHKKLKYKGMASGSLKKDYSDPPLELLDYVKDLTNRLKFRSQAIDLFETNSGDYVVNEMQCIFGQSDPFQMLVGNVPGRYLFKNGAWKFEEGDFVRLNAYPLRLDYILGDLDETL